MYFILSFFILSNALFLFLITIFTLKKVLKAIFLTSLIFIIGLIKWLTIICYIKYYIYNISCKFCVIIK